MKINKSACKQISDLLSKEGEDYDGVRVTVVGGGCSGLTNKLIFENVEKEDDSVTTFFYDIKLYIDIKSMLYLTEAFLDYDDGLNGKGLFIHNPMATNQCGCGESYGI